MSFMISLFGSEQTGKPKFKRRISVGKGNLVSDIDELPSPTAGFTDTKPKGKGDKSNGKNKSKKHGTMEAAAAPKRISARQRSSISALPPEDDEGNVEYKLKLVDPSPSRFQHLVTQMKWRLREGQGEAIYEIGVEDNGICTGLTDTEMDASLSTMQRMASELGAFVKILREREVGDVSLRRRVAEVLVRKVPDDQQFIIDIRIAVLGTADAGKSTLLGVLTQGEMDNGRGKSRLNLFRHLHEVQSGRTSSISMDVMGFDVDGKILNYRNYTLEEICDKASKLITFIDLAGHQKYMRTTIIGLSGYKPHFVSLVVAANMAIASGTMEHLAWANALNVPLLVVVTKIDITPVTIVERTVNALQSILKQPAYKKIPVVVRTDDDALTAATAFSNGKIVPIFILSSVTGENLDQLEKFLNVLPKSQTQRHRDEQLQSETLFEIDEIFNISNVGSVCYGLLSSGVIREGDEMLVGPDPLGEFKPIIIESLQRNRTSCRVIEAGQAASLAVGDFNGCQLRKGLVFVSPRTEVAASWAFDAEVYILYHPSKYIAENFQTTVHIGNVCQTAIIAKIYTTDRSAKQGQQNVTVTIVFLRQPEFIVKGSRLLFREGRTKGIGEVTRVAVEPPPFESCSRRTLTV